MRVTPPPFWYAVFRVFFGRYAVRKALVRSNSVISDADITLYFKKVQFSSRNTTHVTYNVKKLYKNWAFIILNINYYLYSFVYMIRRSGNIVIHTQPTWTYDLTKQAIYNWQFAYTKQHYVSILLINVTSFMF